MKVKSWLSGCSSATCIATSADTAAPSPPPISLFSDSSSGGASSDSQTSSNNSIQSNLSLLTLPSVPSLQKFTLSPAATSTAALVTCLRRTTPVHFLSLHHHLLYAASGHQIDVYDTATNALLHTFNHSKPSSTTGAVKSIAFRGGAAVFTAHQDCKIRVWKLDDHNKHKLVAALPTLEDRLRRFILPQNYIKIRRHKHRLWIEHHDAVSGLSTDATKNVVVSISWDRSIKLWNATTLHCIQSINKAHDDAINAIAISNDGVIYTGSADRKIKAWRKDEESGKYALVATLEKHKSAVNALALSENGSVLFSGSCDRSILVWEREDSAGHMAVAGALRGHAKAVLCLINVHDLLISGSADRTVRIWRRGFDARYCCLAVLEGHQTPVRSLAAAAHGGVIKVFSGSFDGVIRVWEVDMASV